MRLEDWIEEEVITESVLDRGVFKAVFMGGSAGSGKSYVLKKIKSGSIEPRIVNVDVFIEKFGNYSYTDFYDRSKHLTVNQLTLYIDSCLPLFIDITSTDPTNTVKRYNILENLGYDMAIVFVNTSLETAIERNRQRKRVIPDELVQDYHDKAQKMKGFLRTKFPLFLEIKNDTGELTDDVILRAFKKMEFFYDSPVKNPIGQQYLQRMRENGWKYLTPNIFTMGELKQMTSQWYRSTM